MSIAEVKRASGNIVILMLIMISLLPMTSTTQLRPVTTQLGKPVRTPAPTPSPTIAPACNDANLAADLSGQGWNTIFADEFDNNGDLSQWNAWNGGAYNNELQCYLPSNGNLVVSDGTLSIVVKQETKTCPTVPGSTTTKTASWTSGRIESKELFSAGSMYSQVRMSARLKLAPGYGMWPAFWSYGDPWPTQGEIDVMENRGQEPFQYATNYFYGTDPNTNLVSGAPSTITSATSLQTCWHVFEVVWTSTNLEFYLDGTLMSAVTNTSNSGSYVSSLYGKSEKIVLNVAVGGNYFSNLNAANIVAGTMQADWVRVYAK